MIRIQPHRRGVSLRSIALLTVLALVLVACGDSGDSSNGETGGSDTGGSATGGATGATSGLDTDKTYVIATSADFPPMTFQDPDNPGEVIGFEVDMMAALMGHLGLDYEWQTMKFDGLLPAVQAGQVDMVVSDVYHTDERAEVVDFVDYIQSGLAVMVTQANASAITSYMDLCGKSMGILVGSPFEQEAADTASAGCTDAGEPAIDIQTFQAVADELPQLENGRIDAILEDVLSLSYIQQQQPDTFAVTFIDPIQTKSGIVLNKSSTELKAALEDAFQWYKDSGGYQENIENWGIPESSMI